VLTLHAEYATLVQEDLEMAQSQSLDDKNIRQKLALLAKRRKQHLQKEKRTYANMFASSSTEVCEGESTCCGAPQDTDALTTAAGLKRCASSISC
jgi:hypothetical protein